MMRRALLKGVLPKTQRKPDCMFKIRCRLRSFGVGQGRGGPNTKMARFWTEFSTDNASVCPSLEAKPVTLHIALHCTALPLPWYRQFGPPALLHSMAPRQPNYNLKQQIVAQIMSIQKRLQGKSSCSMHDQRTVDKYLIMPTSNQKRHDAYSSLASPTPSDADATRSDKAARESNSSLAQEGSGTQKSAPISAHAYRDACSQMAAGYRQASVQPAPSMHAPHSGSNDELRRRIEAISGRLAGKGISTAAASVVDANADAKLGAAACDEDNKTRADSSMRDLNICRVRACRGAACAMAASFGNGGSKGAAISACSPNVLVHVLETNEWPPYDLSFAIGNPSHCRWTRI